MKRKHEKIPVTVLTGFLGAGKTTLLNYILSANHGQKIAVIVNEFGEVGIDNQLVVGSDEEIFEMNNGCICCTVRGDLIRILGELMEAKLGKGKRKVEFDRVVIETTGLANPAPVAQTFIVDPAMSNFFQLDSIVTLIDAKHAGLHLDDGHEVQEQVAFADVMLLNKIDLVSTSELEQLEHRLRKMNPTAKLYHTQDSRIELDKILGINAFDIAKKLEIEPHLLDEADDHHHHHNDSVKSFVLREERPLDLTKVEKWMQSVIQDFGEDLFRYKGILHINGVKQRVIFQGIHMLFAATMDRNWKGEETRISELVFIGRNLDQQYFEREFSNCIASLAQKDAM